MEQTDPAGATPFGMALMGVALIEIDFGIALAGAALAGLGATRYARVTKTRTIRSIPSAQKNSSTSGTPQRVGIGRRSTGAR